MEDYLQGYLDVVPESERRKVMEVIKQNQEIMALGEWSEEEFEKAIQQLVDGHKQMTSFLPQKDILDSKKHNEFFGNLLADLTLLFAESDLIESGLNSYHRLYEGILSDLRREVSSLKQRVDSLRLTSESENGVIVKNFNFSSNNEMEIYGEGTNYLFIDRDGSDTTPVVLEHDEEKNRILLGKTSEQDRMRNAQGNVTATIEIVDRRGTPVEVPSNGTYSIDRAIDNSSETYWGEVILVDEPINTKMKK